MLQPYHRGIYEYLWSEHKYVLMSISIKSFQNLAAKLGRNPQITSVLRRFVVSSSQNLPEYYNGLLNAYMHIKGYLDRSERFALITTLLENEVAAAEMIFAAAIRHQEQTLYGCRLFYPRGFAAYKFWDVQHHPGLWVVFGPFQLHLKPEEVFWRICCKTLITAEQLRGYLQQLRQGVAPSNFDQWPEDLRLELMRNNMIAMPGKQPILHPQADNACIVAPCEIAEMSAEKAAAMALEYLWDNSNELEDIIGECPEQDEFYEAYAACASVLRTEFASFAVEDAWRFIEWSFAAHKEREASGKTFDGGSSASMACYNSFYSGAEQRKACSGVGMQTADQVVNPEEGEDCN